MTNSLVDIFKIDDIGNRISVRILFVFMLMLRLSEYFFPLGDPDFSSFYNWVNYISSDMDRMMNASYADIPITDGNIIYIMSVLAIDMICLFCAFFYIGYYIKMKRVEEADPRFKPVGTGKLIFRLIVISAVFAVLYIPLLFSVLYLFLIFIIIFPYLLIFPACYLSGDSDLFDSTLYMSRRQRGYYMVNLRNVSLLIMIYVIGVLLTRGVGLIFPNAGFILKSFVTVFCYLAFARYSGMIYTRMLKIPGNRQRPPARPA